MKINKKSQNDLIASLKLCSLTNKNVSKVIFSKFNLSILSFLCSRGFVTEFKFIKEGFNGYILFCLKQTNGALLTLNNIWSPKLVTITVNTRFKKYQSYKS